MVYSVVVDGPATLKHSQRQDRELHARIKARPWRFRQEFPMRWAESTKVRRASAVLGTVGFRSNSASSDRPRAHSSRIGPPSGIYIVRTGSSGAPRDRQFCAPCNGQSASSSPAVRERGIFAHRSAFALQSEIFCIIVHRPPILSSLVFSYLSPIYFA